MRFFLFFLFSVTQLLAELNLTAITENEPSSLVEGVSVITGDFCLNNPFYTVQGAQPIQLSNLLIGEFCVTGYENHGATLTYQGMITVREPYGTDIFYFPAEIKNPEKTGMPHLYIGEFFYGAPDKKKKWKSLNFSTHYFIHKFLGISNTASGDISARTHIKNHRIVFDPNKDPEGKSFSFYASDGTVRRYYGIDGQKPMPILGSGFFKDDEMFFSYSYALGTEELPNGHKLRYGRHKNAQLTEITSTNKSGTKTFASIPIPELSTESKTYAGSDGQKSVSYYQFSKPAKKYVMTRMSPPDQPDMFFCWVSKQMSRFDSNSNLEPYQATYPESFSWANGKTLRVHYYDLETKYATPKVSDLSATVGKDQTLLITHHFVYGKNCTDVFDIQGNKTSYHWNGQQRLTSIRRYIGSDKLSSEERFVWNETLLMSRSLWDANGICRQARSFIYDGHGNAAQTLFSGNLTGSGGPVILKSNGTVDRDQTETTCIKSTYSQDGKHLPLRVEDTNGLVTLYTYVPGTNLVKTKILSDGDTPKITYTYDYDEDYLLIQETMDDGICHKIKKISPKQTQPFLGMPEIIEEKYIDQGQEKLLRKKVLFYRAGARIDHEDVYDADGNFSYQLSYEYDEKNRVVRETNPIGQVALTQYDASGNKIFYQDFGSSVTETFEYDFSNRPIRKILKDGEKERVFEYSYDTRSLLEWESDERGHKTHYKYDALGRCIEIIEPALINDQGELVYPTTRKDYDIFGNETLRIDPNGFETRTEYNAYGKPIHITHPDGTEEHFSYSLKGDLKSHTSVSGIQTIYEYDYLSRVVEKKIFEGSNLLSEETFIYTGSLLTSQIDPEGNVTTYQYDGAGRKIAETFAGETIRYQYDALGRESAIEEGGEITYKSYDLLNQLKEERKETPSGQILQKVLYDYNEHGDQTGVTRFVQGAPSTTTYLYDSFHRVIQKTNALGHIETTSYEDVTDNYSQKVLQKTHTDALGLQTIETFDPQGNLHQIEKKKDKTLSLIKRFYTPSKKLSLQVDTVFSSNTLQREIFTRWEYDHMGREITVIEASGTPEEKTTRKTYFPTGELKTLTKPDQTTIFYEYNGLKHLTSIHSSDGSVDHKMSYNRLGHLQTTDQIERTTDPKGRVLSETFFSKYTTQNEFDECGRRTSFKIPSVDLQIVYSYLGQALEKISRFKNSEEQYCHEYLERDLSRKILKERLIDGTTLKTQTFDLLSRKIETSSPFFHHSIDAFDPVGNILSMTRSGDKRTYYYDDLYQLTEETGRLAHNYSYDSSHNRLTKDEESYEINALHQATSHFTYNLNGCPIERKNQTFTYDALDRLIEVSSINYSETFTYDSQHRRLSRTICRLDKKLTEYYLYDGQKEIGALDQDFQLKEFRVLGETPHAELGAAVAFELKYGPYIPFHDLQNNVAVLADLKGTIVTHLDYTAFGEEEMSGLIASPWAFSSKRRSRALGLVYYGRRCYIPELGRWLTPDPAGFTDGMNLYAFVGNEPLMHFDEYGLWLKPRAPGSFNASDALDIWKRDAGQVWNNPRFQGSLQMAGGFAEMSIGAGLAGTPFAPLGAFMLLHGADHFATGACAFYNRQQMPTLSERALQKTGMSPEQAAFSNNLLSMGASFGALGLRNQFVYTTNQLMAQRAMSSFKPAGNIEQILFGQKTVGPNFSKAGTFHSKPLAEMVEELRNGITSPKSLPVEMIVRDGKKIALNNRSLLCLRRARIEPEIIIDKTGIPFYEEWLDKHLNGNLPSDVIQIRGGPPGTSLIESME